jgi:lipid A 4'-phosphatase
MELMTTAKRRPGIDLRKTSTASLLLLGAMAVGILTGCVAYLYPGIDLQVSTLFYQPERGFYGQSSPAIALARSTFYTLYEATCVIAVVGLVITLVRRRTWLGISALRWLFLVLCLGVGPGLVGNLALKDNWGRARPVQTVEFGGQKAFSGPLTPTDQCQRNCSFVAGEATTIFAALFAAAFLFPPYAGRLISAGVVFGSLAGAIRMSQGAHFLTDVIFAGVIMAITVAILNLMFDALEDMNGAKCDSISGTPTQ